MAMEVKKLIAQIELMHIEALRQSTSHDDKWLNTFHGGRESALYQVLKLLKGV
ncbi:hypothetical protein P7H50_11660 [Enterococcus durans]|uniref:hypothetical protein n=1 Tax=Enterococcus durans TaxID=53345 RepID=UPI00288CCAFE|nr:hypothetical protein [Enterococcus durans]MDT2837521.1 hypothetical protein [Enterococcus durans]